MASSTIRIEAHTQRNKYDAPSYDAYDSELLFGHTSAETARVVEDYPYGFRLRTTIRYWIETTKRGDRFISQTMNPKTCRWNKPKPSIYSGVMVMRLDHEGHITRTSVMENDGAEWAAHFAEVIGAERLSEAQRARLAAIIGYEKVMAGVSWSVRETNHSDMAARVGAELGQVAANVAISRGIARETAAAAVALNGGA